MQGINIFPFHRRFNWNPWYRKPWRRFWRKLFQSEITLPAPVYPTTSHVNAYRRLALCFSGSKNQKGKGQYLSRNASWTHRIDKSTTSICSVIRSCDFLARPLISRSFASIRHCRVLARTPLIIYHQPNKKEKTMYRRKRAVLLFQFCSAVFARFNLPFFHCEQHCCWRNIYYANYSEL